MTMESSNPLLGVGLHAIGAFAAACCYLPQQKLRNWSWQTYWLSQALVCWLIAPIIGASLTVPHLAQVLSEAPRSFMLLTFGLGVAYGIGGTAFALAIRHIGYSLTYAIAIGISCVVGTLAGPVIHRQLGQILDRPGSGWVLGGVVVGVFGTFLCGIAGRFKEMELFPADHAISTFSLSRGLSLCIVAGLLSAVYGIAIGDAGQSIVDVAAKHGAGVWQTNVVYLFANTGALLTAAVYSIWLMRREHTFSEFLRVKSSAASSLVVNYFLAITTGCLWYSQFLFYGLGHVHMGQHKFSSWAIHMIMLILFSSLVGVGMREWKGCRLRTGTTITVALALLIGAVLMLTYGNYIAEQVLAA